MKLRIYRVRPDAILPRYANALDSGLDLYAHLDGTNNGVIFAGDWATFPTGIAISVVCGDGTPAIDTEAGRHIEGQIRPRSGLARKHGVVAVTGTIDSGYRGEIGVTLINHGRTAYRVEKGDRIAQLCFCAVQRFTFDGEIEEVWAAHELGETERGTKGFGSSGR